MKFGVLVFPGSNCDDDMMHVTSNLLGAEAIKIWHKETNLEKYGTLDGIFIPGGFSYGDYLRSGAIAKFSPIMKAVISFANEGGFVFGICNGFQILCEAGLLPGVLLRNKNQKFICKNVFLKTVNSDSFISTSLEAQEIIKIPIAHADGRYYANEEDLKIIEKNDQIIFKYCDENGNCNEEANLNGSVDNIAGICNQEKNVFGMMPHPERAAEKIFKNTNGAKLFDSIYKNVMSAALV